MNGKVRMMTTLGRFRDGIIRAFQTDRVVSTEADFIVALTSKNVGTIRLADDIVLRKPITLSGTYNTVIDGGGRFGFKIGRKNTANYLFDLASNTVADLIFVGVVFDVSGSFVFMADDSTAIANNFQFQNVDLIGTLFGKRGASHATVNNISLQVRYAQGTEGIIAYTGTISYNNVSGGGAYYHLRTDLRTRHIMFGGTNVLSADSYAKIEAYSTGAATGEFIIQRTGSYMHTEQTQVAPTLKSITLSGSDPVIDVEQYTNIRITTSGPTSGNASFSAGIVTGHQVLVIFEGTQGYSIPASGTFKSHSNFNPGDHDTLLIVWNASHNHWLEVSRSNN
jgi:hypothetical protein